MHSLIKAAFVFSALLIASPALAEHAPPPASNTKSAPDQINNHAGKHQRGRVRLTPEQKIMMHIAMKEQVRSLPKDQRKAYIQKAKADFRALTPEKRQLKLAELEQRWNAMPLERRNQLMQKFQERQARRDAHRNGDKTPGKHRNNGGDQQ
ncbi:MAG: hypothetical protein HY269_03860 [Deltaproteobacteria bacterium]|nr:hypothetical protein [Deltaproteobacteria bacterium]